MDTVKRNWLSHLHSTVDSGFLLYDGWSSFCFKMALWCLSDDCSQKHYIILLYITIIYYMKYYRNNNQGERYGSEGKGNEHLFLGMEPRVLHMWYKWHHSKTLYYWAVYSTACELKTKWENHHHHQKPLQSLRTFGFASNKYLP